MGQGLGVVSRLASPEARASIQHPKMAAINDSFKRRLLEIDRTSRTASWVLLPLSLGASLFLLVGGIQALRQRARSMVKTSLATGLVVDLAAGVFSILMGVKTMSLMSWYYKEAAACGIEGARGLSMAPLALASVPMIGWFVLKPAYYIWGLVYLGRPHVKSAFDAPSSLPPPSPS